jgi:hypothetical protein
MIPFIVLAGELLDLIRAIAQLAEPDVILCGMAIGAGQGFRFCDVVGEDEISREGRRFPFAGVILLSLRNGHEAPGSFPECRGPEQGTVCCNRIFGHGRSGSRCLPVLGLYGI